MKKEIFISVFLVLIITLLFSQGVSAADIFDAEGIENTLTPSKIQNIENWPEETYYKCKIAQDKLLKECEEEFNNYFFGKGSWKVERMIDARGTYEGKPFDAFVVDDIIGKWECPSLGLQVDNEGNLLSIFVYNLHLEDTFTRGKTSEMLKTSFVTCDLTCFAWSCPLEYDPYETCEDAYFTDNNGDGKDDNEGYTKQELIQKMIYGPFKGTDGHKGECDRRIWETKPELTYKQISRKKIAPLWQFWKKEDVEWCGLTDYTAHEIKVKNAMKGRETVIRVCSKCSCQTKAFEEYVKGPTYDPKTYEPLKIAISESLLQACLGAKGYNIFDTSIEAEEAKEECRQQIQETKILSIEEQLEKERELTFQITPPPKQLGSKIVEAILSIVEKEAYAAVQKDLIIENKELGIKGIFQYDPDGKIKNYVFTGKIAVTAIPIEELLNTGWEKRVLLKLIREGRPTQEAALMVRGIREEAKKKANEIWTSKQILMTLEEKGMAASPEAYLLENYIKEEIKSFNQKYGEIFKEQS